MIIIVLFLYYIFDKIYHMLKNDNYFIESNYCQVK